MVAFVEEVEVVAVAEKLLAVVVLMIEVVVEEPAHENMEFELERVVVKEPVERATSVVDVHFVEVVIEGVSPEVAIVVMVVEVSIVVVHSPNAVEIVVVVVVVAALQKVPALEVVVQNVELATAVITFVNVKEVVDVETEVVVAEVVEVAAVVEQLVVA